MRYASHSLLRIFVLALAIPFATAQGYSEDDKNWDAHMYSLERFHEIQKSSPQEYGSGEGSGLAPALVLAIIGGALLEWSRTPQAQRPQRDYAEETRRQRQGLVYGQCKSTRQSSLVQPQFRKPNSWAAVRIFQSDRAEEFTAAQAQYQAALAQTEPTCRCVGERSVSGAGFSEAEWQRIAASLRRERPWMALEEARARDVFDACAAHSPSDARLSWLYGDATP